MRLAQLAKEAGRELEILVIEKGGEVGNHGISGAVMDPRALDELLAGVASRARPWSAPVTSDELWFLTQQRTHQGTDHAPAAAIITANTSHRCRRSTKWLGEQAEEAGRASLPANFRVKNCLWDGDRVDRRAHRRQGRRPRRQTEIELRTGRRHSCKVVVLGEGPRGTLAKQAFARLRLDEGSEPQVYAAGVKELWQLPDDRFKAGTVIHTLGYPLPPETFGGGFIYGMEDDILDIGHVTGLDYKNPTTDPHNELQRMKQHPEIRKMLEGAKLIRYGAKAIPEGGLFAMPRLQPTACCSSAIRRASSTACGSKAFISR